MQEHVNFSDSFASFVIWEAICGCKMPKLFVFTIMSTMPTIQYNISCTDKVCTCMYVCKCTAEHFVQIQVDNPGPNTLKIYIGNHPLSSVSFIFYLNFGLHSIIMLLCWASSCIP